MVKVFRHTARTVVHPADFTGTTAQQIFGKFFVTKMRNEVYANFIVSMFSTDDADKRHGDVLLISRPGSACRQLATVGSPVFDN